MGSLKSFLGWSRSRDATFPLLLKGVLATGSAHARPSDRAPHRHKREKKLPNVSDHFSSSGGGKGGSEICCWEKSFGSRRERRQITTTKLLTPIGVLATMS